MNKTKIKLAYGALTVLFSVMAVMFLPQVNDHRVPEQSVGPLASPATIDASPKETETVPVPALANIKKHTVRPGETVGEIAVRYNLDVDTIMEANPEIDEIIHPGDELVILPQKGAVHIVEAGDTLWDIARIYDVEVAAILAVNGKKSSQLAVEEKLLIPGGNLRQVKVLPSRRMIGRFAWPARGELTSCFGYRWGRLHAGIDIANDPGSPVRAAQNGRVVFTGWLGGYGYTVVVEHGRGYETLYGHLSDYLVAAGEYVRTGQVVGHMGSTGYSTGPHLHFEIRAQGYPVNPLGLLP